MRRKGCPGIVALGLWLVLAQAATVQAQGNGLLEGQVVNGTAGGPAVGAGLPVTLHLLRGEEVSTQTTTTGAGGTFRFTGLDTDPTLQYRPEVVYLGVPYSSAEPYQFDAGQTTLPATLMVFETTDNDQTIRLDMVHLIVESFGQVLRVSEVQLFGNTGDRTYVGRTHGTGRPATVSIPLPPEAVGLSFPEDTPTDRYLSVEGGLLDTDPVRPGEGSSLVFFSYHLMVSGPTVALERRFAYPVTTLNVLAARPGLELRSDRLQSRGTRLLEGQQYGLYTAQDLDPATPLEMELLVMADTGTNPMPPATPPADASPRGSQGLLRRFGLAMAGLAAIGAGLYSAAVHRPRPTAEKMAHLLSDPQAYRLLVRLADLEEDFAAGQVDEPTYRQQRDRLYKAIRDGNRNSGD